MLMPGKAHAVMPGAGRSVDLGVATMRVLAGGTSTGGSFTLAEVAGTTSGPWTVPHLHRTFEESFLVLDGSFTFTVGDDSIVAEPGAYILVPRDTAHTIVAAEGGGSFVTLMVPGGHEEMFFELGALPGNAILDPVARAEVAARYDSQPVT
jgi:quercetin dioxygenase-like cupin family protein